MMESLLVGAVVGAVYCFSLQRTSFGVSISPASTEIRRALVFFSLRLLSIALVFLFIARWTELNMSSVVVAFITVYSLFLFHKAGKTLFYDINNRRMQPKRRI